MPDDDRTCPTCGCPDVAARPRLYDAAPELLEAAKLMIENIDGSMAQAMYAIGKLKLAVAKAEVSR